MQTLDSQPTTRRSTAAPRVLLIIDQPADLILVRNALQNADPGTRIYDAGSFLNGLDSLVDGDIDLVLLDLTVADSQGLEGLRAIRMHAPALPVVVLVVSDQDSTPTRALQMGAEDYWVKSKLDAARMARVLQRLASHAASPDDPASPPAAKRAAVLGVLGSKGGVGATTVACHLAMELQRQVSGRVLLMDLDMAANCVALLLKAHSKHTLLDAAHKILHLEEAAWRDMVARIDQGLEILPSGGPLCRDHQQPGPARMRLLLRFIRSLYEWVIIDFGRLTPVALRLCSELSQILLVSSLDAVALHGATAAVHALHEAGMHQIRLVINRAPKTPELSQPEIEKLVKVPIESMLSDYDEEFKDSINAQHLLGRSRHFSAQIVPMASKLSGQQIASKKRFGFLNVRA